MTPCLLFQISDPSIGKLCQARLFQKRHIDRHLNADLFVGSGCLYRQRMNPVTRNTAKRLIHHALPHHPVYACKYYAFYFNRKMRLPRPIIAAVAMMFCTVVDYSKT